MNSRLLITTILIILFSLILLDPSSGTYKIMISTDIPFLTSAKRGKVQKMKKRPQAESFPHKWHRLCPDYIPDLSKFYMILFLD